jgi:hydrogenase maturation protease
MNILVLGIGQSLCGDDAAGLAAVRLWQEHFPQTALMVQVELCELPGPDVLDRLEGLQAAILVDAVHAPADPGTIIRLGPDKLDSFTADSRSSHGWGVAETLALGHSLYPELAQCRLTLIGVVGDLFDLGEGLSPAVQAAMSDTAALIEKEIQVLLK